MAGWLGIAILVIRLRTRLTAGLTGLVATGAVGVAVLVRVVVRVAVLIVVRVGIGVDVVIRDAVRDRVAHGVGNDDAEVLCGRETGANKHDGQNNEESCYVKLHDKTPENGKEMKGGLH